MRNISASSKSVNSGVGIGTVIQVVFVVLKLAKVISWPWLWVFAPIWMSVLLLILIGMAGIVYVIATKKK